jgi:hypothetical protein
MLDYIEDVEYNRASMHLEKVFKLKGVSLKTKFLLTYFLMKTNNIGNQCTTYTIVIKCPLSLKVFYTQAVCFHSSNTVFDFHRKHTL